MFSGATSKSRFLAEFTLSDKQVPRFARNDKREGLGMTATDPFCNRLLSLSKQIRPTLELNHEWK